MRLIHSFFMMCAGVLFSVLSSSAAFAFCATYEQTITGFSRGDVVLRLNTLHSREVGRLRQRHGNVDLDAVDISCSGTSPVRCTLTQAYCVADRPVQDDGCPGDSVRDRRGRCVKEAEPDNCPRGTERDRRGRCVEVVEDDGCPGDSVRDRRGRCVKEAEPENCPRGTERDRRGRCVEVARDDGCPGDSVRDRRGRCVKEDEGPAQAGPCSGGRLFSQSAEICHCPELTPIWTGQRCIRANVNDGASNNQIIQRCRRLEQECQTGVLRGACRALRTYCDRG
jgi:hypothetical protein